MNRYIIRVHDDIDAQTALVRVGRVISEGRVSAGPRGLSYCWLTTFNDGISVSADRNKASDRFVVWKKPEALAQGGAP